MPNDLKSALTPEAVAEILAERGISVTPKTIREKAIRLGPDHYCRVGRKMFFFPAHIDELVKPEAKPCICEKTAVANSGKSATTSPAFDSRKALARLTRGEPVLFSNRTPAT